MTSSSTARSSLAVIPARGGSKRIPRKNIRVMNGRPLIVWAIESARACGEFSDIVVSTDDDEIAGIARECGASVPFMRSTELADDFASTVSVVADAVERMQALGFAGDLVCCIYPAAILVTPTDLEGARALLDHSDRPYAATIVRYPHPIQRAFEVGPHGELTFVDPTGAAQRSQDLPPRWHDAGQFYWGRVDAWRAMTAILPNAVGYQLPADRAVDIDTEDDWLRAERLHATAISR